MQIEIHGQDAVQATEELLRIARMKGLEGSYETFDKVGKKAQRGQVNTTLITIATGIAITSGTLGIADQLYQWKERIFQNPTGSRIEKVIISDTNGNRLLLEDATVEQIQKILDNK